MYAHIKRFIRLRLRLQTWAQVNNYSKIKQKSILFRCSRQSLFPSSVQSIRFTQYGRGRCRGARRTPRIFYLFKTSVNRRSIYLYKCHVDLVTVCGGNRSIFFGSRALPIAPYSAGARSFAANLKICRPYIFFSRKNKPFTLIIGRGLET